MQCSKKLKPGSKIKKNSLIKGTREYVYGQGGGLEEREPNYTKDGKMLTNLLKICW